MQKPATIPAFDAAHLKWWAHGKPTPEDEAKSPDRVVSMGEDPRLTRRARMKRAVRIMREDNAVAQLGELPAPGEFVFYVMTGNWHGWDIMEAVLRLADDAIVERAYITTLGFNVRQADHLGQMIDDGRMRSVTLLISEMFTEKNAGEFDHLRQVMESRGQRVASCRNHTKLIALQLQDGRCLVNHSSANLRRCNSLEAGMLVNDAGLFDAVVAFVDEVIEGSIS